jgi:hypothetical protein
MKVAFGFSLEAQLSGVSVLVARNGRSIKEMSRRGFPSTFLSYSSPPPMSTFCWEGHRGITSEFSTIKNCSRTKPKCLLLETFLLQFTITKRSSFSGATMEKRRLSFDQDRSMIRCLPGGSLLPTSRSQGVRLQPAGSMTKRC